MTAPRRALVVSRSAPQREQLQQWLLGAGYQVTGASDFPDARTLLETTAPDLLVSDVKLEAYNGLHLAIWTSGRRLPTRTMLIGDPDLVLQKEAEREHAMYMLAPLDQAVFLSAVTALLETDPPTRRSPRKRVEVDAVVDGVVASVIDVSYGGLCVAVDDADAIAFPPFFTLRLPNFDMACRVQRVWTSRDQNRRHTLLCGARLPGADGETAGAWRAFVDTVPDRTSMPLESAG